MKLCVPILIRGQNCNQMPYAAIRSKDYSLQSNRHWPKPSNPKRSTLNPKDYRLGHWADSSCVDSALTTSLCTKITTPSKNLANSLSMTISPPERNRKRKEERSFPSSRTLACRGSRPWRARRSVKSGLRGGPPTKRGDHLKIFHGGTWLTGSSESAQAPKLGEMLKMLAVFGFTCASRGLLLSP